MKTIRFLLLAAGVGVVLSSCSVFGPKYGCPTNGKNVGAEKLLSDPAAARKAKKFKA